MSQRIAHTAAPLGDGLAGGVSASWRVFLSAYLGWIFDYFEVYFLTIVIVPMARSFGWSPVQVSTILSAQLASIALVGVFWGYM